MTVICQILSIISIALLVWIVLGWVVALGRVPWGHPVRKAYDVLARGFEPVLRPIRSVLPAVRMGNAGLDLSPLVLIIGIQLLAAVICR